MANPGPSLVVQWLRICASTAGGMGLIPDLGSKIPHALQCSQKKKKDMVNSIIGISEIMRKFHIYPLSPYSLMASHGYPSFQALGKQS